MQTLGRSIATASTALAAGLAHANLIENGSFELGNFAPPGNQTSSLLPGATALSGWQVVNDSVAWIGMGNPWGLQAQQGDRFLDLSDYAAGAPFGGVQQSFATSVGYEYKVDFQLGSSTRWGRPSGLTVGAAGQSATFASPATGTNNDWQTESFTFVAHAPVSTLSFVGSAGVNYIGLDNVNVSVSAIPEPGSLGLLLAGCAVISASAVRRRPHRGS